MAQILDKSRLLPPLAQVPGQQGCDRFVEELDLELILLTLAIIDYLQGGGGGGVPGSMVSNETPSGAVDGSNTIFTTINAFIGGNLMVFLNGLKQRTLTDFIETGTNTFQLTSAPLTGDSLRVEYIMA
jgi:hypothetical protein